MGQQRYSGMLKKWNAERGFGFITADDGGQDIFVHVSAFARDGGPPQVGEALGFAVEPDRNGKLRAVQVLRPGEPVRERAPQRPQRRPQALRPASCWCPQISNVTNATCAAR